MLVKITTFFIMKRSVEGALQPCQLNYQSPLKIHRTLSSDEVLYVADQATMAQLPEELYELIIGHLTDSHATLICLKMTSSTWRTVLKRRTDILPEVSSVSQVSRIWVKRFQTLFLHDVTLRQFWYLVPLLFKKEMMFFEKDIRSYVRESHIFVGICAAGRSDIFIDIIMGGDDDPIPFSDLETACLTNMNQCTLNPFDYTFIDEITQAWITQMTTKRIWYSWPDFATQWILMVTSVNAEKFDSPTVSQHLSWVEEMYITRFEGYPAIAAKHSPHRAKHLIKIEKNAFFEICKRFPHNGEWYGNQMFRCFGWPQNIALLKWLIDSSPYAEKYIDSIYIVDKQDAKSHLLTEAYRQAALKGDIDALNWLKACQFLNYKNESYNGSAFPARMVERLFCSYDRNPDNYMDVIDWFLVHQGFLVPHSIMRDAIVIGSFMSFAWTLREYHSSIIFDRLSKFDMITTLKFIIPTTTSPKNVASYEAELVVAKYELLNQWIDNGEKLPEKFENFKKPPNPNLIPLTESDSIQWGD